MVIHSAYLNVHTHSCLYKLEKCGSRTVTYYNKKKSNSRRTGIQNCQWPQLWNNSPMLKLAWNPWKRCSRDPVTKIHDNTYRVLKSNHQNSGLEIAVSKTLGEGNTNGSECQRQCLDSATIHLPSRKASFEPKYFHCSY